MISDLNIPKVLGQGSHPVLIISSAVLAITIFFYIFTIGSYFHIGISPLENRVNYHHFFATYVIDKYFDHLIISFGIVLWLALSVMGRAKIVTSAIYGIITIIATLAKIGTLLDIVALISIPIVASFLFYNRFASKKILHTSNLPLTYLAIIGVVIGFVGTIISSAPLFSITLKSISIHDYAYEIFSLLSSLSPILVFFLILGSPIKLFIQKWIARIKIKNVVYPVSNDLIKSKTKILYLLLFMLLSLTITLIPHQSTINSDNQQVGSDSSDYVIMINKLMESNNPQEFAHNVFTIIYSKDRSVFSLFLYTIVKITHANTSYTADRIPMLLAPVLVLVVFFLTRELTSNDTTSLLASFLTAVSFHTLIGLYSGIYANWFALIIGYLSLVFLIRFLKVANKLNLLVYSVLMMLLVFSHANTWTIFAMFEGLFLVVIYKMNYYNRKNIILILIVVLSSVAIDVVRSSLTGTSGGIASDVALASVSGTAQLTSLWSNIVDTTQFYSGGQFSNFIIFALGLYWLFRSNWRQVSDIFVLLFLALAVLPLLVGDSVIQSRVLYDIPFQIPAAIGLTYLWRHTNGILMTIPICIWLFVISIRMVTNFYYISPS
jgi:hypothetical protein